MTEKEMIKQLIKLYPKWEDDSHVARLRVSGIKRLIQQAYAEGLEEGHLRERKKLPKMPSSLESIFGAFKK